MKPKVGRQSIEVHLDAKELGVRQRVGVLHRPLARTDLLWPGEQHPPAQTKAFGIFLDSAPDRWGSVLMERREAAASARERRSVIEEVKAAIARWRRAAEQIGCGRDEVVRMKNVFQV